MPQRTSAMSKHAAPAPSPAPSAPTAAAAGDKRKADDASAPVQNLARERLKAQFKKAAPPILVAAGRLTERSAVW